jgi:N-acetylmuramoyl-L-alanine amidase
VRALGREIVARHRIPARNVIAHSDIAPDRKEDPGELFPWKQLAASGVGLWVEVPDGGEASLALGATGERVTEMQRLLAGYGYGIEANGIFDPYTRLVVVAFQRHFRPSCFDGVADGATLAILRALMERLDAVA